MNTYFGWLNIMEVGAMLGVLCAAVSVAWLWISDKMQWWPF